MDVFHASNPLEYNRWIDMWIGWEGKEVYAHPDYVQLYIDEKSEAMCACISSNEGCVLYPFILRDLSKEPYCSTSIGKAYDIITPYGYGGPYVFGNGDLEGIIKLFFQEFGKWAIANNIVCEFVRFSLDSFSLKYYPGEGVYNNDNIIVDLTLDKETTWKQFKSKVRKNVNRATQSGVVVRIDDKGQSIEDFLDIYYTTMDRCEAKGAYYFQREYFERIHKKLGGQFIYFHALYNNIVISTELVLVSDNNLYSFLGGTKSEYFDFRPNDLLKYEIINWGQRERKRGFILGGGYEPHDGIYNYKLAFCSTGIVPFFIGKRVFDQNIYSQLVECKHRMQIQGGVAWNADADYFPLYRR